MFIIYVIDLSTKNKTGVHIFTKIKNTDDWKKKKNVFFSYFVSVIPDFSYMDFFRKYSMFRRSISLNCQKRLINFKSSHRRCFIKTATVFFPFFNQFHKIHGTHMGRSLFFNKVAGLRQRRGGVRREYWEGMG